MQLMATMPIEFILLKFVVLYIFSSEVSATFCPDIEPIQHGDIRTNGRLPYRNGTVLTFTCDRGYKGNGLGSITCTNGRWSDPVPYCSAIHCRKDQKRVEEGRKCRKSCESDVDCKGTFKKCLCDGWCGKSCFNPDANCPALSRPENGYIVQNEISYGYTVTYGCDEGYILTGRATRRCQADRKWSGYEPKCVAFGACGQPGDKDETLFKGKVTEGKDAQEGAWPWQALFFNNYEHNVVQIYVRENGFGGGSIIDDKWILTAAHIFKNFPNIAKDKNPEVFFLIAVGLTTLPEHGQALPEYVNIFEPQRVYINENFNNENFDYDVALVRIGKRLKRGRGKFIVDQDATAGKIVFSRYIRPVCLPCIKGDQLGAVDIWRNFDKEKCDPRGRSFLHSILKAGEFVMVTGFGWKRNPGEDKRFRPKKLQEGLLKIADDLLCIKSVQEIQKDVLEARYTDRMLCAGSASENARTDSCQGDSGGPLVKQLDISDHTKYWILVGIVSWGWGCGNEHPGYYTSVTSIMPWVWEIIDDARVGTWYNWASWSKCSRSCGGGKRSRSRICMDKNCPGPSREEQSCNIGPCPLGKWSEWATWSICTRSCSGGKQSRSRVCIGDNCVGSSREDRRCNTKSCPSGHECPRLPAPAYSSMKITPNPSHLSVGTEVKFTCNKGKFLKGGPASVTCLSNLAWSDSRRPVCVDEWGPWTTWSACTATCNGASTRTRVCKRGSDLFTRILGCSGPTIHYKDCNTNCEDDGNCGKGNICVQGGIRVDSQNVMSQLSGLLDGLLGGR